MEQTIHKIYIRQIGFLFNFRKNYTNENFTASYDSYIRHYKP